MFMHYIIKDTNKKGLCLFMHYISQIKGDIEHAPDKS